MKTIKPLGTKVLLIKSNKQTTSSGLVLTQSNSNLFEIVAKGPNADLDGNIAFHTGDIVAISTEKAVSIFVDNKQYLLVDAKNILATIKE